MNKLKLKGWQKMSRKRFLRSDFSAEVAYLYQLGEFLIGSDNQLTLLFKCLGKYDELNEQQKTKDLVNYNPIEDNKFKYENRGYAAFLKRVREDGQKNRVSRKHLKNLSRKWKMSPALISFESTFIVEKLISICESDKILEDLCLKYSLLNFNSLKEMMPIQGEFLSVRQVDKHKDYLKAIKIINELSERCCNKGRI